MKKLILSVLLCFALGCGNNSQSETDDELGVQTVENAVIYESQQAKQNWILSTTQAKFHENSENAVLINPQLSFKEGDDTLSIIKGDEGTISMEQGLIVLKGNVFGKSISQNAELRTTLLNYDINERKIWTERKVEIKRNGVTVTGQGLRANGDFSEIEIKNQTTTLPEHE
ncbi:protein of unknown function DUF1239 [Elusimicrobium minutum Pei191]|uniref:LPS export ABC transporter periplasmic protein LptC n=1 Tax=Elusimicrobium minutum (strain Pei191) TaxID=445932 RepID=B2KC18_ELUMP|nr:LPS export ABC transporter periplasmic protein LptC [Elusimicrobium minutum]ACC98145.1 protein of unknown function DUF1239 [Elusimicrobium minutum Pei191]